MLVSYCYIHFIVICFYIYFYVLSNLILITICHIIIMNVETEAQLHNCPRSLSERSKIQVQLVSLELSLYQYML